MKLMYSALILTAFISLTAISQTERPPGPPRGGHGGPNGRPNPSEMINRTLQLCQSEASQYCNDVSSYRSQVQQNAPARMIEEVGLDKLAKLECLTDKYEEFPTGECRQEIVRHVQMRLRGRPDGQSGPRPQSHQQGSVQ